MKDPDLPTLTDQLKTHLTPKKIGRVVVSSSVRFVVVSAIANAVPTETKIEKIKVYVGSYVIAELIVTQAKDFYDVKVTEILREVKAIEEAEKTDPDTDVPNP